MAKLLPKNIKDFGTKSYWDEFFLEREKKAFEWYGDYKSLRNFLRKIITQESSILVIGCGNSDLSADLYDDGYTNIINMDFSPIVIKEMSQKNAMRKEMKWDVMDVTQMTYSDQQFKVVLDKGALDAIDSTETAEVETTVLKMFSEIKRVCSQEGGVYICISLLQSHVFDHLFRFFGEEQQWDIEVYKLEADPSSSSFSPFGVVFKHKNDNIIQNNNNNNVNLYLSPKDLNTFDTHDLSRLKSIITEVQWINMSKSKYANIHKGSYTQLELFDDKSNEAKYNLFIFDTPKIAKSGKCGIFIVPQGREHEWLFSTREGQEELSATAGFQRLIIVHLSRKFEFENGLKGVQEELSSKILTVLPSNCQGQVPFMTVGESIGNRKIIHEGVSSFSGKIVVEDVETDGEILRRLIFLDNPNVIQSEAKVLIKDGKSTLDFQHLTFDHHKALVGGLSFVLPLFTAKQKISSVIVGLGGGIFPMFLYSHFFNLSVEAVELDSAIVDVAKGYFSFVEDERMKVTVADGLVRIHELSQSDVKQHIIIIDVDSKDVTVGMSCPPKPFVEKEFLETVRRCLDVDGVLMLNLVCRSASIYEEVINTTQSVFEQVIEMKMEEDVNRIIFCFPQFLRRPISQSDFTQCLSSIQNESGSSGTLKWNSAEVLALIKSCKIIQLSNPKPSNPPKKKNNTKKKKKGKRK